MFRHVTIGTAGVQYNRALVESKRFCLKVEVILTRVYRDQVYSDDAEARRTNTGPDPLAAVLRIHNECPSLQLLGYRFGKSGWTVCPAVAQSTEQVLAKKYRMDMSTYIPAPILENHTHTDSYDDDAVTVMIEMTLTTVTIMMSC